MQGTIFQRIAEELGVRAEQVRATARLLDEGATVPFIARYRKEVTGGLDDTQLRTLESRLAYLRELEARRETVLDTIRAQGRLTPELEAAIRAADSKTRLEDLYRPYQPKRRSKAQKAREAGLGPLAEVISADPGTAPETLAADFVDAERGVPDVEAALEGARQILMEGYADDPDLNQLLRERLWRSARLASHLADGQHDEAPKFEDYFDYHEPLAGLPSHRALALLRGRRLGVLSLELVVEEDGGLIPIADSETLAEAVLAHHRLADDDRPGTRFLRRCARDAWRIKLATRLESELKQRLKERAEEEAIAVFAANLKDVLMAAPAGPKTVMGLDPGFRAGVKVAVVDPTGRLLETATIHPHAPQKRWDEALDTLQALVERHRVDLIAIGNGTASRETDRLADQLLRRLDGRRPAKVLISEAGASVYSASPLAAEEFPDLDVALRGAVSIARRLQDPLAELVKIDPKAIGVGQYQHDVNQRRLAQALEAVVEDCVNAVGVNVNTASVPLLARVSGLGDTLARHIVAHREQHGPFTSREQLRAVPRLGAKTFEQAAGFLRVPESDNPLDNSAVHPEAYPLVQRIAAHLSTDVRTLIGDAETLRRLDPARFTDERFGEPTVRDILAELEKPGRDPRPEFVTARFRDDVREIADIKPGMILEGVVSNVTNFGAFVDIGVHQDGLIHISQLSERFVKDPRQVVRAGQVVRVRVLDVDPVRKRVGLSLRLQENGAEAAPAGHDRPRPTGNRRRGPREREPGNTLAHAFRRARRQ